jgi:hypothetical protein
MGLSVWTSDFMVGLEMEKRVFGIVHFVEKEGTVKTALHYKRLKQ